MEARAQARFVRVTPMKARRVVDLIRGMSASEAQAVLVFAPQAASEPVGKVLNSAIANAANNHNLDPATLVISEAYVDEGPTMKRFRPRARGSASRIRKRTCHITVIVSRFTPAQLTDLRARETQSGRAGSRTGTAAAETRRRRVTASRELAASRAAEEEAQDHEGHDHEGHDHEGHDHEGHDHGDEAADDAGSHGAGRAEPLEDGSGPEGFDIKGDSETMLYHVPDSRYYEATKAEVYFATVEDAERAGFAAPGSGDSEEEGE